MRKIPLFRVAILAAATLPLIASAQTPKPVASPTAPPSPEVAAVAKELNLPNTTPGALLQLATKTVTYKTVNGLDLQIHVFIPEGLKPDERRPALFFIHGGGWIGGDPAVHALECIYFARLGMVTASISYRLLPITPRPGAKPGKPNPRSIATSPADCLADAKSAFRYFRSHAAEFHVDPDKIVAAGGSAGGHLAAALATIKGYDDPADDKSISTRPAAMILIIPAFNLVSGWKGGQIDAQKGGIDLKSFSPALLADKTFPPSILMAGTADGISTEATDKQFIDLMKSVGGDAELVEFAGRTHALYQRSPTDPYFQAVVYFMDKFLTRLGYLPAHQSIPAPTVSYETFSSKPSDSK